MKRFAICLYGGFVWVGRVVGFTHQPLRRDGTVWTIKAPQHQDDSTVSMYSSPRASWMGSPMICISKEHIRCLLYIALRLNTGLLRLLIGWFVAS